MEISNNQETSIILFDNNGDVIVKYGMGESDKRIKNGDIYNYICNEALKNKIFYLAFSISFGPTTIYNPDETGFLIIDNSKEFKKVSMDNSIICEKFVTYLGTNNFYYY